MNVAHERTTRFLRDWNKLAIPEQERFAVAVRRFAEDLMHGRPPRPGLRVKPVQAAPGIFEITFAPDGRATWEYGQPQHQGETRIIWRRIGGHGIFANP
ncbi:hypothetical protein GCM10009547_10650 [Sporichthya brevicatena]|uniref:Uncharacterized protein n=1 Tax=Sporichthya brevicatena TaxID=171442 RepID=A0ABN1GFJ1_9ACTN